MTPETIAALLAACLDVPEVATGADVDGTRVWLYVDGSMFRIDVTTVATSPAREVAA